MVCIYIYIIIDWKGTLFGVSPVTCFYVGMKTQWKWKIVMKRNQKNYYHIA